MRLNSPPIDWARALIAIVLRGGHALDEEMSAREERDRHPLERWSGRR